MSRDSTELGDEWWREDGPMAALHRLNPVRVAYLRDVICRHFPVEGRPRERYGARPLNGLSVLDIGCGAGLLAEPLARSWRRRDSDRPRAAQYRGGEGACGAVRPCHRLSLR